MTTDTSNVRIGRKRKLRQTQIQREQFNALSMNRRFEEPQTKKTKIDAKSKDKCENDNAVWSHSPIPFPPSPSSPSLGSSSSATHPQTPNDNEEKAETQTQMQTEVKTRRQTLEDHNDNTNHNNHANGSRSRDVLQFSPLWFDELGIKAPASVKLKRLDNTSPARTRTRTRTRTRNSGINLNVNTTANANVHSRHSHSHSHSHQHLHVHQSDETHFIAMQSAPQQALERILNDWKQEQHNKEQINAINAINAIPFNYEPKPVRLTTTNRIIPRNNILLNEQSIGDAIHKKNAESYGFSWPARFQTFDFFVLLSILTIIILTSISCFYLSMIHNINIAEIQIQIENGTDTETATHFLLLVTANDLESVDSYDFRKHNIEYKTYLNAQKLHVLLMTDLRNLKFRYLLDIDAQTQPRFRYKFNKTEITEYLQMKNRYVFAYNGDFDASLALFIAIILPSSNRFVCDENGFYSFKHSKQLEHLNYCTYVALYLNLHGIWWLLTISACYIVGKPIWQMRVSNQNKIINHNSQ